MSGGQKPTPTPIFAAEVGMKTAFSPKSYLPGACFSGGGVGFAPKKRVKIPTYGPIIRPRVGSVTPGASFLYLNFFGF